jgi:hypothetical protein
MHEAEHALVHHAHDVAIGSAQALQPLLDRAEVRAGLGARPVSTSEQEGAPTSLVRFG